MATTDFTGTLEDTLEATGLPEARVRHRPRLLTDNGPCYISGELKYPRRAVSPADPGQDRTVSPFNEERGQAGALLLPMGVGAGHLRVGRALQPQAIP